MKKMLTVLTIAVFALCGNAFALAKVTEEANSGQQGANQAAIEEAKKAADQAEQDAAKPPGFKQAEHTGVVSYQKTGNPNSASVAKKSPSTVLNESVEPSDIRKDRRYYKWEVESSKEKSRTKIFDARNAVKTYVHRVKNAVSTDVKRIDFGTDKDLRDALNQLFGFLKEDEDLFTERDPVAGPKVRIGENFFVLSDDDYINVIGKPIFQAIPIMDGNKVVGHYRAVCGGKRTDQVLANQQSYSYCVTSLYATGVTRTSDVHPDADTRVYFAGVTEKYLGGIHKRVKVNWEEVPVKNFDKFMDMYDLHRIEDSQVVLEYDAILNMDDGSALPAIMPAQIVN